MRCPCRKHRRARPSRLQAQAQRPRFSPPELPDTDVSFIFAVGEHEIVALPETSPWADKYRDRGLVVIGMHTPEFASRIP